MANATLAGCFSVGGERSVARLGVGATRLAAAGAWDLRRERAAALKMLRALPELGVNFVSAADSYGPELAENIIREAIYPYSGFLVATKGGFSRIAAGAWSTDGRPENLVIQANQSRDRLGVDRIDLWHLERIDSKVPCDEQFDAIRSLASQGVIRFVGLNEVSIDDLKAAQRYFPVAIVQNRYNLVDRSSQAVLDYCDGQRIGFLPWYPFAHGDLARPGRALHQLARKHRATPQQITAAWILRKSSVVVMVAGAAQISDVKESVAATVIHLSDEDVALLDRCG